jgi:hypothetical protein
VPLELGATDMYPNSDAFRRFRFIVQIGVGVDDDEPTVPHVRLGYVHLLSSCLFVVVSRLLNAIQW